MSNNRYELGSAARKIDGYYNPQREKERALSEFERARNECANHLRRQLLHVEQINTREVRTTLQILRGAQRMTQNEAHDIAIALIDLRDSTENSKPKGIANSGNCGSDSGVFVQRILARFPKVRDAVCEIDILRAESNQ